MFQQENELNHLDHRDSEEYQDLFENAIEGIFQSTMDGCFLKVNPAMAHIFGYESPDDMVKSVTDISKHIHVDDNTRNQFIEKLIKNGYVKGFEARNYRKDRSIVWTQTNARAVRDEKGNILYFEGFLTDITARKEAEFALRDSEERYRALVERLPGVVFLDTPDNPDHTFYISPRIKDLLGYSQEEWISYISWSDLIHPEDRDRVLDESKRTDETGEVFRQEYRLRRKDGQYIWIREETSLVKDERGAPLFWQGFFLDITHQKQAESAIRQSEEQFKRLFQANPIASCIATVKEGRFLAANDAYWRLSGFMPDEFLGHTSVELGFVSKKGRKELVARLLKAKSLRNESGKIMTKSGEFRNTLEFYDLINFNGQECILSMLHDITDQVQAQDALRENEEKYRQLFEAESDAIFLIENESGRILEANEAATALYGYSKDELLSKHNFDLSAEPEDTRSVTQNTPVDIEQVISIPLRFHRKKDGTVFPVEITGRFFMWHERPVHIAAIRDIRERRRVEEALRESEQNFRNIVEHTTNIYYSHTPEHILTFMSPKTREILGYEPGEALTDWQVFLTDNPVNQAGIELTQKAIDTGMPQQPYTLELRHKDGHHVWVEVRESPIVRNGKTVAIVGALTDITDRKSAEETLGRQLRELSILHNVAVTASSSKSMDELIQRITNIISDTLHPDNCGVELLTESGDMLVPHASYQGASGDKARWRMHISQGVTGKVASTGLPIRLGDVSQESAYIEATVGVKSELCVPIKIQDRIIGVINVESKTPEAFSEEDERLFHTIAGTLATAIEQLRLLETTQRRMKELTILNEVSLAGTDATSVDELIEKVTQIIGESLYPDNVGVLLLDKSGESLYPHSSYRGITDGKFPKKIPLGHGISGQVAASGKSLRIANVRNYKEYIEVTSQVRSELCVPIVHGDHILGVINAESLKINAFTEDDERLLITIASTLATAIEKLHLLEAEKERRQEAEILLESTKTLTTFLNLDTLLDTILETLYRIVPYDSASIAMEQDGKLIIVAGKGFPSGYNAIGKQLRYSEKWVLMSTSRQPLRVPDVHREPRFEKWEGSEYIRGWMGVPMVVHDKLIGFINLDSRTPDSFTEQDAVLAQTFANSAAVAIENARLFEAEQRRHRESEALRQAALAITNSMELGNILDTILVVMQQVIPYDSASILLLEGNELRLAAVQGLSSSKEDGLNLYIPAEDELFNAVRDSQEPVIIKNVQHDKRFRKWANADYVQSWMGVALMLRNEIVGYLTLDSCQEDIYNESYATLAQAFANQAASAIQNMRQFEAEQHHYQEAETLRQAAEVLTSTLDIQQVLASILDNLNKVVPFDSAGVFLIEDDKVRLTVYRGMPEIENFLDRLFPASNALLQEIWQTKQPLILKDAQEDPRFERWVVEGVHGWLGVPLIARGNIIGYITIDSLKVEAYNFHDANLAMTFAHQAAVAIENARLYERGEQQIRQLTVLRDIDSAISSSFDLRVTLNLLIGYAARELNGDAIAILLYNPDLKSLSFFTGTGFTTDQQSSMTNVRIGEGLAGNVLLQRKLIHIADLENTTEYYLSTYNRNENFKSYYGVPLICKGQIKGVMEVYFRQEQHPDPDWFNFLQTLAGQAAIAIDNVQLFKNLQRSNQELTLAYDTTLAGWGRALELRDKETQGHTDRVVELTLELARHMGIQGEELTHIMRGALLHDIGKMGIPDHILHKPGPLTEEEWGIMRQHPQYAFDLMNPIPYLRPALDIPYAHHERWDGSGYPRGLKGEAIPLAARIFAVVDIWDALLYERVYRGAWPEDKVIEYLKSTAGIELDPTIVGIFLGLLEDEKKRNQAV